MLTTILRIIGISILIILALVLLILLIIFFVPIRYQGNITLPRPSEDMIGQEGQWIKDLDQLNVHLSVFYLLHLLELSLIIHTTEQKLIARVLFWHFDLSERLHSSDEEEAISKKPEKEEETTKKKKKTSKSKLSLSTIKKIPFHMIGNELKYLSKHWGPRKFTGQIQFCSGDPAMTGYSLGIMSVFPVTYSNGINISPDFITDQPYVYGNIMIKGHLRLIHALFAGIKLILNPNIRKLLEII